MRTLAIISILVLTLESVAEARVSVWQLEPPDLSVSMRLGALEAGERGAPDDPFGESGRINMPTSDVPSPGVAVPFMLAAARTMRRPSRAQSESGK